MFGGWEIMMHRKFNIFGELPNYTDILTQWLLKTNSPPPPQNINFKKTYHRIPPTMQKGAEAIEDRRNFLKKIIKQIK